MAFLEVKNALVKLAYCVTECTVCRLVVACGAQCLLVSAVLTNDILGQRFIFAVFPIIFHCHCLVPMAVAIQRLCVVQGASVLLPSLG